jgi:flagella basal body P-ring formation protein FlgA
MFRILLLIFISNIALADVFLVPNHDIQKDAVVNADDFSYDISQQKADNYTLLESDAYNLFHKNPSLIMRAKRHLKEGQKLRKTDIYHDDLLIKRGESVKIIFAKNNLIIEASGIALSSGKLGSHIKVKSGNKILEGAIKDDGSIIIE